MTSEGLGDMFEGDPADTFAGKFPLVWLGGQVEGLACADLGARTPIGDSGNIVYSNHTEPTYSIFVFPGIQVDHKPSIDLRSEEKKKLSGPCNLRTWDRMTISFLLNPAI
jgi:hypothetical protein